MRQAENPLSRMMRKVVVNPETHCWEYAGCINKDGYGMFKVGGQSVLAHRWMFGQAVRPLAATEDADHLCRNRRCCNPCHLEACGRVENRILRVQDASRRSATHIPRDLSRLMAYAV